MKKITVFILGLFLITNSLMAQSPLNSLDFDGTDDYATSALPTVFNNIPNNDFTIEAWIKPNGNIFSRIIFAQLDINNFVALSVGTSNLVYLYVSNNTSKVTSASLPLGVWSHVACTWDASASQIDIYINGVLQSTTSGGSSSTGNDNVMTIGARTNAAQFFPGELDEVRIWDIIRTPCEISSAMSSEFTVSQPNLVAYYNFNQGTAGGTNTGITTLPDFTTNYNATLLNFNLTGSSSNWISSAAGITTLNQNNNSATGTDTRTECNSYTWIDGITYTASNNTATFNIVNGAANGCDSLVTLDLTIINSATGTDTRTECNSYTWIDGITYTASNNTATFNIVNGAANGCDSLVTLDLTIVNSATGTDTRTECNSYTWIDGITYTASNNTATFNIVNGAANGCDSLVTLDLTINGVSDLTTSTSGVTISANNTGATYQWLDCDNNNLVIVNETGQSFTAIANGNYAVELTENGCVDTSDCVAISTVGIVENDFGNNLLVYPNPTNGNFSIDLGAVYDSFVVSITDLSGKLIDSKTISQSQTLMLTIEKPAGIYIVFIQAGDKKAVIRLVKE